MRLPIGQTGKQQSLRGQVISAAAKEFEEKTGATIDLQFKGRKGIKETLIPTIDSGQKIDMWDGPHNKSNFGDRLLKLDDLIEKNDYEKDTNPVLWDLLRSYYDDGGTYEIPYQMKANGYLYNKKHFEEAGIEEAPKTWDEFLTACEKLKESGVIPITTDDAYSVQAFGMHLARLIGDDKVIEIVKEGNWDHPAVLETAETFQALHDKGYFSPQVGTNIWPTGQNTELATGLASMYCAGTFVVNEVKTITGPDFEWGFFGYPELEDGVNGLESLIIGCQSYSISSRCEHPEVAFDFIQMLTRGEWDDKLAEESLSFPADINNDSWPEQLSDARDYMMSCTDILATAGGLESNPDILPALKVNLIKLYAGSLTAEEFVNEMIAESAK